MNELRISQHQREDEREGLPRWVWVTLIVLVLLALIGAGLWWGFKGRPLELKTASVTTPAAAQASGAVLQATGYLTARRRATVSTQITGTLTQVLIEEGDRVEKGQVLARLEDNALRAGLASAEASVQAAEAQVNQAQAQLAQARLDADRAEALAARGMIGKQAAEQARTAANTSAALLDVRRREVEVARAQVAQAKVNYDYTFVRAPFSGVITEKAAQVGEIVSPLSAGGGFTRTGIGTIVDMDSLEVDVDVNEAYIGQVKPGMQAEAVLDAYPDWKIPAHLIAIVPAADRGKATVKVRVGLDQKDARMVPDMGVRISFLGSARTAQEAPAGVLVPEQAIVQRDGATAVFVVNEGRAQLRKLNRAPTDFGGMKLVTEGLHQGEQVVLAPPQNLTDGARVVVP